MGVLNTLFVKNNVENSRWTTVACFDCSKWTEEVWKKVKAAISVKATQKCPDAKIAKSLAIKAAVDASEGKVLFTASMLAETPKTEYKPIKPSLYETLHISQEELLSYLAAIKASKETAVEALKGLC